MNFVVAICVEESVNKALGATGIPVKLGEFIGDFKSNNPCKSDEPNITFGVVICVVNTGLATFAFSAIFEFILVNVVARFVSFKIIVGVVICVVNTGLSFGA